ncbi:MAG: hypothetical protein R3D88_01550 [Alphaproteobacteria bacterium]|nr:hypothetical protein [Alphaproteobacteria bacterium]
MKQRTLKDYLFYLNQNLVLVFMALFVSCSLAKAETDALRYDVCVNPQQSLPCAVAFEKLRATKNPINKKNYFDDEVHIKNDKLLSFPTYYIAQPDLDHDGVKEIIVALLEDNKDSEGLFCKSKYECPHFIIQDRNVNHEKPRLKYYATLGAPFAYGIGLSTDERVNGYQSLRIYTSDTATTFDVYQYDKKDDQYYKINGKR